MPTTAATAAPVSSSTQAAGPGLLPRTAELLLCARHGPTAARAMALAWVASAAMLALACLWLPFSRLSFASHNLADIARVAGTLLAVLLVADRLGRRVEAEEGRAARLLAGAAERLSLFCAAGLAAYAMTTAGGLVCFLAASLGWPLRDADLAALDRTLGFDWPAFLAAVDAVPPLAAALVFSYHATGAIVVLAALWLTARGEGARLAQYVAQFALATLGVNALLILVPAAGAYAYFRPDPALFSHFSPNAGVWHMPVFEYLRAAPAPVFDLDRLAPIVTFPSFHTVCGILATYALRDTRALLLPAAAVNGAMIVATLPEGGHYLVDVLAGAAIAVVSILLCRRVARGR